MLAQKILKLNFEAPPAHADFYMTVCNCFHFRLFWLKTLVLIDSNSYQRSFPILLHIHLVGKTFWTGRGSQYAGMHRIQFGICVFVPIP